MEDERSTMHERENGPRLMMAIGLIIGFMAGLALVAYLILR